MTALQRCEALALLEQIRAAAHWDHEQVTRLDCRSRYVEDGNEEGACDCGAEQHNQRVAVLADKLEYLLRNDATTRTE